MVSIISISTNNKLDCNNILKYMRDSGINTFLSNDILTSKNNECIFVQNNNNKLIEQMWDIFKFKYNIKNAI